MQRQETVRDIKLHGMAWHSSVAVTQCSLLSRQCLIVDIVEKDTATAKPALYTHTHTHTNTPISFHIASDLVSSRVTRQHLWSAGKCPTGTIHASLDSRRLVIPRAATRAWNALPQHVRNAPSLFVFRQELKTVLFWSSFPDAIWQCTVLICHHVLAATNWCCWNCTVVLQQQCDNAN